jgi:excisionase family DNA binding protein
VSDEDDMMTTGEVAALLGTTVQHVVDLCMRGDLSYAMAGTHRRIRRADARALADRGAANRGGPLTHDQVRSLWLHRAVAARVAMDPDGMLTASRTNAERLLERNPDGAQWVRQWLRIIDTGPEAVMRTLTSTDPLARELRQNSPFLGLLPDAEREAVIAAHQRSGEGLRVRGCATSYRSS